MQRSHLNIALAGLVAGLGAAVWFSREAEPPKPALLDLPAGAPGRIEIRHPEQPEIVLERTGESWRLTAPVQTATDPLEVSNLTALAGLEVQRSLPVAEVDLAELELDPPRYSVTLDGRRLDFGSTEPIEHRRYVREGERVALVLDPPGAAMDADYSELVSKQLLPDDARIERIELPGLTVARDAGGAWQVQGAEASGADAVQQLVDAWRGARAMWNAARPEDAGEAGEPLRIVLADGELRLRIVAREPQLQLDRPDLNLRYTLSKADADRLLQLPEPEPASQPAADESPAAAPAQTSPADAG